MKQRCLLLTFNLIICSFLTFVSNTEPLYAGTFEKQVSWPSNELPPADEASIELMAGQMLMVGFRGLTPEANPEILSDIKKYHIGGIILFDRDYNILISTRNVTSKKQLTRLVSGLHQSSTYPLFVAVDQEGGNVRRLKSEKGFLPLPSAFDLGNLPVENTEEVAENLGRELTEIGINMNFAPVADVNIYPQSPAVGALKRSFSSDSVEVTNHARAFLKGLSAEGIIGSLKHFPGHGSAMVDTHKGITDITGTWRRNEELLPYETLIPENLVDMVMVGHLVNMNIDPEYPASLSKPAITGLLREELGYDGVVISDDLEMGAITSHYKMEDVIFLAIDAGMDILLYGNNINYDPNIAAKVHSTIFKLVEEGKISRERLEESYTRIRDLKSKLPQ